jgi:hypothetical protein
MIDLLGVFKWIVIILAGGVFASLLLDEVNQYGLKRWKMMTVSILMWWLAIWILVAYW